MNGLISDRKKATFFISWIEARKRSTDASRFVGVVPSDRSIFSVKNYVVGDSTKGFEKR